jgi:hypothetical protein
MTVDPPVPAILENLRSFGVVFQPVIHSSRFDSATVPKDPVGGQNPIRPEIISVSLGEME